MDNDNGTYGLSSEKITGTFQAPKIDYLPKMPKSYHPKIGLIGAGGISEYHLKNYKECGFDIVAIANRTISKARKLGDQYYPNADIFSDYRKLLERKDIEVLDITPHPHDRFSIIKEALASGKHVLSQKPFVLNLKDGRELVALAKEKGVKLAVNQNGQWAPHFSYMRKAIESGLIGRPVSVDFSLQWDQTWIKGNPGFENMRHMVLFDFAIHWFDIIAAFMQGQEPINIYASTIKYDEQVYAPPALAACIINYGEAMVTMSFNAHTTRGEEDVTTVVGTKGTLRSRGPGLNHQPRIELFKEKGKIEIPLEGCWFENGFKGTMSELLCSIEEDREPINSAEINLKSLELCFAALESANTGKITVPGEVVEAG